MSRGWLVSAIGWSKRCTASREWTARSLKIKLIFHFYLFFFSPSNVTQKRRRDDGQRSIISYVFRLFLSRNKIIINFPVESIERSSRILLGFEAIPSGQHMWRAFNLRSRNLLANHPFFTSFPECFVTCFDCSNLKSCSNMEVMRC